MKSESKPQVVLVGSHLDCIPANDKGRGKGLAEKFLKDSQAVYDGILEIDGSLILVDGRDAKCNGIETLKGVLKTRREKIVGTEKLPKLCEKMQKIIKPWREEDVPVISWQVYQERVKRKYPGMDEETLREATKYLHLMGEVYWAEFETKDDQIILNTQWFTTNVIGAAFAGEEFAAQFPILPNKPYYSKEDLCSFFTDEMDPSQLITLLGHMDLVHETKDKKYLLPGKLPADLPEVVWDDAAYDIKGISIACVDEIDIFNPNVWPSVQKKLLDENECLGLSRSAVMYARDSVKVLVQMPKTKRAINIAAMCPNKDGIEACNTSLQEVVERIQLEISEKSSGTTLRKNFMSQKSLQTSKNLEDVVTYTRDELIQAETGNGFVGKNEDVTNVLFQGYDKMFLQEFGADCRYEWLPVDVVTRCFRRLDRINEWEEDYRAVGKALKIEPHEVDLKEQPTNNIIKSWCKKNKRKMTIGMLHKLLSRLSLVTNEDALIAVEELIHTFEAKHPKGVSSKEVFEPGVSEYIVSCRLDLKRQWRQLKADMDPRLLVSRLEEFVPPDICAKIRASSSDQRVENVETVLQYLLHCEEETCLRAFFDAVHDTAKSKQADQNDGSGAERKMEGKKGGKL
ncbi:death-associated protein kinase 1-like [Amphiura filiformis]|uniref:death-associated protein kinase 1-like n=1 Tax=Amphiura filiformis TaxID=82378 RepID=UPI003B20B8AD